MNAAALTPILWLLTIFAWGSFAVLSWAAFSGSRVGALTERTFIAFVIAILGTVASILRYNSDQGFALFPQAVAALAFAITMLVVLAIPTAWLVLWFFGRLGEQQIDRDAILRRLDEGLRENTRISQGARDDAHEAAEAANAVNEKIANQGEALLRQGERMEADRERHDATIDTIDATANEVHDLHEGTAPEKTS